MNVTVTDIQRFCMHDGPGIRTVVFLKGCPLHCAWCHNPETQAFSRDLLYTDRLCAHCGYCGDLCPHGVHTVDSENHIIKREQCEKCGACAKACPNGAIEISGRSVSTDDIIKTVLRDVPFYHKKGGLTLSGGEPMAQPEGVSEILRLARASNVNIAIETSGAFPRKFTPIAAAFDSVLFDIKDTDAARLMANTGATLSDILDNLRQIDSTTTGKIRLRCIILPEINMNEAHYCAVAKLQNELQNCEGIELIPYHSLGLSKSARLGRNDRRFSPPDDEAMQNAAAAIRSYGGNVIERRRKYDT